MRKSLHAPACRLTVVNLTNLIKILEQGMGDKKSLSLSYELKGTEMPFDSLNELLEHADTPSTLYSMVLSADDRESSKRTFVSFYDNWSPYVVVEGTDEAWVVGKSKQIENFLINKKAKFSFLHDWKIYLCLTIITLIYIVFNSSSKLGLDPITSNLAIRSPQIGKLVQYFGLLSSTLLGYVSLLKIIPRFLYPYTKIKLKEGWDINTKINLVMLILAILSILTTIVIFILSEN